MAEPESAPEPAPQSSASFGYWVRRRRLALDLTQAGLARAVSCATITIAKIERDERRPSRQMAALLADRLAVPPAERARFLAAALGEAPVDRLPLDNRPLGAPPAAPTPPPSSLPTPATPFVGRRRELEQLAAGLAAPACRLLTLLGAGGFGKTRLAIRLGELALAPPHHFPDGVFFVPLEGLADRGLVVPAAAAALAFTFYEQEGQEQQLLRYLAPKRLLLILDNAEEVLDPDLVLRLLAGAPGVKILVTTRAALNLQQEWLHPIGGLDAGAGGAEDDGDPQLAAAQADAVLLFHQCALRVQPAFDLGRELVPVQQICRLVEGAPLAIELAAAWLKVLPCAEVARELAHGIDLLTTAMRDVPPRHRSMRAVLAQSWDHLAADEQQVFRGLAIFEGGFGLEAAQAVVGAPLAVLAALVEKAMLQLAPGGRYRIHALLRQLGAEQLAAAPAELAACRERHAAYFLAYLAARRTALEGHAQLAALREIQEEMDNIRAAWSHAAARGPLPPLSAALPVLFRFLWMRGRYAEGEQMARQALEGSAAGAVPERIALAAYAAHFGGAVGAYDRALAGAESALDAALRGGHGGEAAHCLYVLGIVGAYLQDHTAIANLRAAYASYRAHDNEAGTAEAALQLGFYLWAWEGDHAAASALVEESLARFRALGDAFGLADALNYAGILRWYAGDVEGAERLYRESLQTANTVDNRLVALQAAGGLAFVALARGQWDLAIDLQQERLALAQRLGHDNQVKHSLSFLVPCYICAERFPEAVAVLDRLPEAWHLPYAGQAYVGVGAYTRALAVLGPPTAEQLAHDGDSSSAAILLVGWAMLLASDCPLLAVRDPAPPHRLSPAERQNLAVELLAAVQANRAADPATRSQAARLLASRHAGAQEIPGAVPPRVRPVRDLAGEMLALRLG